MTADSMHPITPPGPGDAVDPVCGMSVNMARAKHKADLGGRTWYFCSAGCREKFVKDPQRYARAGGAGAG